MSGFFTKKQKAKMRERQRRKKHQGGVDDDSSPVKKNNSVKQQQQPIDHSNNNNDDKRPSDKETVKRKEPAQQAIEIVKQEQEQEEPTKTTTTTVINTPSNNDPSVIIVPADLSGADARKFRKDARRKAREQGLDESKLTFVVPGTISSSSSDANDTNNSTINPSSASAKNKTNTNNNKKRAFPCIKDLVEQERKAKQRRLQAETLKQEESALTEEYKARYVALDCEMVGIGSQGRTSALARASLVDWNGQVLLDTFVQVPTRVTDFRTHVSGVTPQHLKHATAMDLNTCRDKVAALLKHKVLVGHALHNDLAALLLQHPKNDIRDTATYRPFQRCHFKTGKTKWRPRKLRDLVKEHLQLDIQTAGNAHDSIQDAWATMQLFQTVRSKWEEDLLATKQKQSKQTQKRQREAAQKQKQQPVAAAKKQRTSK